MIRIDRLSFGFTMNDESFAHHLYANWDEFCRDCFEKVIEECLSAYDQQKVLIEIDKLELDLGTIPEEEFYDQFPIRLREELLRCLHVSGSRKEREIYSWEKRLENLLHYLEYGFCYAEWADADFNVDEELEGLMEHFPQRIDELLDFCFRKEYVLERLVRQTDDGVFARFVTLWNKPSGISMDEKCRTLAQLSVGRPDLIAAVLVKLQQRQNLFLKIISWVDIGLQGDRFLSPVLRSRVELSILEHLPELLRRPLLIAWKENMLWLSSAAISQYEKRRYLGILLDTKPEIPVRFIHETREEGDLDKMAEILDSVVVRQIMITESESHAEVDIPAYWHYLYDWLIKYYPFNGVAIFGGKQQFQKHLNRRLLAFIRRRNYTAYLAKAELTLQFLLEVFGHDYYLEVLAEIYRQQPRNPDGSPVYTGYFNMELYHIFLKLSLLVRPASPEAVFDFQKLTARLTDTRISREERREILMRMLGGQTAAMRKWLPVALKEERIAALLAELVDNRLMLELVAIASFYAAELFSQVEKSLRENKKQILWLTGLNENELSFAVRKSMLVWMGRYEICEGQTYIQQYMHLLYSDVAGGTDRYEENEAVAEAVRIVSDRLQWTEYALEEHGISSLDRWIKRLEGLLTDSSVSVLEKRRIFARWMESYKEPYDRMFLALQAGGWLKECIGLMHPVLWQQLVSRLIRRVNTQQSEQLLPVLQWIRAHDALFSAFLPGGKARLEEKILVTLAQWSVSGSMAGKKAAEIFRTLLTELFGQKQLIEASRLIYQELTQGPDHSQQPTDQVETEYIWHLLLQAETTTAENKLWVTFEKQLNTTADFMHWLKSNNYPREVARELLRTFAFRHPLDFIRLIQAGPADAETIRLLCGMIDFSTLLQVTAIPDIPRAEILAQVCEWLQRRARNFPVIGTTGKPLSELLTDVLLRFLLSGTEVSGKSISARELIRWFVVYIYRISTGQTNAQDLGAPEWKQLENNMAAELGFDDKAAETEYKKKLPANFRVEDVAALLHSRQHTAVFQRYLATILEDYPEQFFAFIRDKAGEEIGEKLAECTDRLLLEKWLEVLASYLSSATSEIWRKYTKALLLLDEPARKIFIRTLFHWIKRPDWKRETPEQMTDFLFRQQNLIRTEHLSTLLNSRQENRIFQSHLSFILEHAPERFIAFIENEAGEETKERLAECTDRLLWEKWLEALMSSLPPACSELLLKYTRAGIFEEIVVRKSFVRALCQWIKKSGWKNETPEQMIVSLFQGQELANLIGNIHLSDQEIESRNLLFRNRSMAEWAAYLTNPGISDTHKQHILRLYIGNQSEQALELIRLLISRQTVSIDLWTRWLGEKDCLQLLAVFSVSQAEIVQQVMDYLSEKQIVGTETLRSGLIRYFFRIIETRRIPGNALEIVRQFVNDLRLKSEDIKSFLKGNIDPVEKATHFPKSDIHPSQGSNHLPEKNVGETERDNNFQEKDLSEMNNNPLKEKSDALERAYDSLKEKKKLSEKDRISRKESETTLKRENHFQENRREISDSKNLPEEHADSSGTKDNLPKEDPISEELLRKIETDLSIGNWEENIPDELSQEPEYTVVSNVGLVLLAPWLPRLFGLFGLLTEDKKNFIDTEARKRAIFMLQYLVYSEEKEYRESELAFNRVLVNCSFHVPLPKRLALTDYEKKTLDSMLIGVKANWSRMERTSMRGFQTSFIQRNGRLEQTEEKWTLTVEKKAYDILLDSLPWPFEVVRLPWLKKQIYVDWFTKKN